MIFSRAMIVQHNGVRKKLSLGEIFIRCENDIFKSNDCAA